MPSYQNKLIQMRNVPCVKDNFLGNPFWCYARNDVRFGPRTSLELMQHMRVFCVRYEIQMGQLLNTASFELLGDLKGVISYHNDYGDFQVWPKAIPGKHLGIVRLTEQLHCNIAVVPYEIYCWRSFKMQQPLGISMEDAVWQYFKKVEFKPKKSHLGAVMPRGRGFERRAVEFFANGKACNEWGLEINKDGTIRKGQDWCGVVPLRNGL